MAKSKQPEVPYKGTQQNLYSICILAWGYCLKFITEFFNISERYTPEFVAEAQARVVAAKALPSQATRDDEFNKARKDLLKQKERCAVAWQQLKDYIIEAFPKDELASRLAAAGQAEYEESGAGVGKYDVFESMLTLAKAFLKAHSAKLAEDKNMPAAFPKNFETLADAYTVLEQDYAAKKKAAELGTGDKLKADIAIYEELQSMLRIGKKLYAEDPVKRSMFIYDSLLDSVRGNSPAGVKGMVSLVAKDKKTAIAGVLVSIVGQADKTDTTKADGRYELEVASGMVQVQFEKEGFVTQVIEKKVRVGSKCLLSVVLVPANPLEGGTGE